MTTIVHSLTATQDVNNFLADIPEDLSMEGFSSIGEAYDALTSKVEKVFKILKNEHQSADINQPNSLKDLDHRLDRLGLSEIADTIINRVPKTSASFLSYTKVLISQLTVMQDIEKRLYVPTNNWVAGILNDPDRMAKAWISKDLKITDLKAKVKEMQAQSKPVKNVDLGAESAPFKQVFPSISDMKPANQAIFDLHELLAGFDLISLKATEERLVANLGELIDLIDEDGIEEWNSKTQRMVGQSIAAIAAETEYVTMLLFQANLAIEVWNNNLEKLTVIYADKQ